MTARPNLFDYAPSELSQDAFLCWLLSWADRRYVTVDPALHRAAMKFLGSIGRSCEDSALAEVQALDIEVKRQYKSIDILALISIDVGNYALAIEDKIGATMTGDQLPRYHDIVRQDFPDHEPLLVYLKTGEVSEAVKAKDAGYVVYSRKDFLEALDSNQDEKEDSILREFHEHLRSMDRSYNAFRTKSISEWINDWQAWHGFFGALQCEMQEHMPEWGYAPNQSGGELVFYWGALETVDGRVYLEIHKKLDKDYGGSQRYFLGFKVSEVREDKNRSEVRGNLYKILMETARKHGWGDVVDKPRRFGFGNTMVFCETTCQHAWLMKDAHGRLDMAKTIERLHRANELLRDAANAYDKQGKWKA